MILLKAISRRSLKSKSFTRVKYKIFLKIWFWVFFYLCAILDSRALLSLKYLVRKTWKFSYQNYNCHIHQSHAKHLSTNHICQVPPNGWWFCLCFPLSSNSPYFTTLKIFYPSCRNWNMCLNEVNTPPNLPRWIKLPHHIVL